MKSEIRCPVCGGRATIGWYPHLQEGECWCHDCGLSIRKHFDSREDAEPYFENMGKHEPQTADEMFAAQGYKKAKPLNHNQIIRYERWETPTTHWEIIVDCDRHYWFRENGKSKGMTEHEIRALARLIEEMEESK